MIVYILFSENLNSFYIGYCQNMEDRFLKHQSGFYNDSYTKKTNDWIIFWTLNCFSISQAIKIEKHIKNMKSKKYILNLKNYPEISEKLLQKYLKNKLHLTLPIAIGTGGRRFFRWQSELVDPQKK